MMLSSFLYVMVTSSALSFTTTPALNRVGVRAASSLSLSMLDPTHLFLASYDTPLPDKLKEASKILVIFAAFGGGLIPACIAVNRSIIATLSGGKIRELIDEQNNVISEGGTQDKTLDVVSSIKGQQFVETQTTGEKIFPFTDARVSDVETILKIIQDVDSFAKWKDLPSTKVPNLVNPDSPPMWLPRATFKANMRKKLGKKVTSPDSALDAVFDSVTGGAGVMTFDKASSWIKNTDSGSFSAFKLQFLLSKSSTMVAIITFVTLQVTAFGVLFIAPFLREFLNVDVGWGVIGTCAAEGCQTLF